jgi:hypothetical protein
MRLQGHGDWRALGLTLGVFVILAIFCAPAQAASATVAYQGALRNTNGTPVPDGNYAVTFSIWDALTAGSKQWEESYASVALKNGLFSVQLGSTVALGTLFSTHTGLWLEISADTGAGLETYGPRIPLTGVPYAKQVDNVTSAISAVNAVNADTVDSLHAPAFSPVAHVHAGEDITSGTISTDFFSAYADLTAESRIGAGATQVAAGNHTHADMNFFIGQVGGELSGTKNLYKQDGDINVITYGGSTYGGLQAPVTGTYWVYFQQLTQQTTQPTYLSMRLNNVLLAYGYNPGSFQCDIIVGRLVSMNAGDVISFTVDTYVQYACWGSGHSSVSMHRVE